MELTGYEDLRVQKTINGIYTAFEALICEKAYEKITVKALAERAQINKKTFYRYYPTLDDLLAEMQARYAKDYLDQIKTFQYPRDLAKSLRVFFTYSAAQGEAYDRITTSGRGSSYVGIRQQMIDQVMGTTWGASPEFKVLSDWQRAVLLTFIQQTGLTVYQQWIAGGKTVPLDEVIAAATALMQGGVNQYLQLNR
ncbi:TetR/AcrR family transcriptional regulator [Levilactobacillus acidifarinae]|uniref:Transcription regulator n=1 Tax=Levilactobacillus acidifarinae DSM 19394 = JCM 15949 TaxID=1423715 RepID=A0A0R1LUR5_9LACO|nr:TetR/AcrR family transcriptional regulator [Levilactobacillus acidifarinae]KRK96002.1 transcription regulator [Levilactobacillus acidifarinae DSM 19394]GEO69306.1 TetR family transcriptional regulator [Levilactobacillus acidifarinae]